MADSTTTDTPYTPSGADYGDNYVNTTAATQLYIQDALQAGALGLNTYATATGKPVAGAPVVQPVNNTPYLVAGVFVVIILVVFAVIMNRKSA